MPEPLQCILSALAADLDHTVIHCADKPTQDVSDHEQVDEANDAPEERDAVTREIDREEHEMLANVLAALQNEKVGGDENRAAHQQANRNAPRARVQTKQSALQLALVIERIGTTF